MQARHLHNLRKCSLYVRAPQVLCCYLQVNKPYRHHGSWLCMVVSTSLWLKAGVGNLHSLTALYVVQLVRAGSLLHPRLRPQSDLLWSVIQPQSHQKHLCLSQSSSMASLALLPISKLSKRPIYEDSSAHRFLPVSLASNQVDYCLWFTDDLLSKQLLIPLFHICCPQCCTNSIAKCKSPTGYRDSTQQRCCNAELPVG